MDIIQLLPKIANISLEATVIALGCTRRALGTLSLINWLTILPPPSFLTHPLNYIEFVMTVSLIFSKLYYKSRKYTFSGIGMPILQSHLARGLAAICLQALMVLCGLG